MTSLFDTSAGPAFDTVLVANRGEIAVRVIRTLRALGLRSVAVYSDADADAAHVHAADVAVRLGPAPARESYLAVDLVVAAAVRTGAGAVHPGYGFLSENAAFAAALDAAGIVFLGPPARAIEVMGDKITAKKTVTGFGVPVIPGIAEPGLTDAQLLAAAPEIGFPVLVKPSAGGGGKGMRRVADPAELPAALVSARREAAAAFGDDTLFLERFVTNPRHIEVQVLADAHGAVLHLGERECSLQRRHQKVIEEAPSPLLDAATRERIGAAACATARSVDYRGVGTVEFIVSADRPDEFFFMEMNTRLQVEHPVTEMVTGVDLVECQVRVAAGQPLVVAQGDIALTGHAVEARVYAEDPGRDFLPTGGTVLAVAEPAGVRVDSGLRAGTVVGSDYDPMLAKVIAYADDRGAALAGLDRALGATVVLGLGTNVEFLRFLLADPDVVAGNLDTGLLDRRVGDFAPAQVSDDEVVAAAVADWLAMQPGPGAGPWAQPSGWRLGAPAPVVTRLAADGVTREVRITGTPDAARVRVDDGPELTLTASALPVTGAAGHRAAVTVTGAALHRAALPVTGAAGHRRTPPVTGAAGHRAARAGGTAPGGGAEYAGGPRWTGDAAAVAGVPGVTTLTLTLDGVRHEYLVAAAGGRYWLAGPAGTRTLRRAESTALRGAGAHEGDAEIRSPMPGSVIAIGAEAGTTVAAGDPVVVVEAMKMEHTLTAPVAGTVELLVTPGTQVRLDQVLARITASTIEGLPA
ncbi:acetyl/propionyl/methylcrotonyl-CoA carboxylase subunit alpha [Nocardia asteroides]|uniref:acetyl/propionyl/methylcrotonyl-CoA carboxylase subunit alpha n=1 Tax=Nocardia asteroides TaxID=1824 RepID=UPI001E3439E8|nr:biotin carboxylase N-terminal domain-containing protein [Nocardia asteroides]UGT64551.1 acetyl/propionyl-CoA carboxylase subunit alpha [Nocardia asteroides]